MWWQGHRDLFAASTVVAIGNGQIAAFWTSSWAHGNTPKNLAPTLFKKAKRKKITVSQALKGNKWISHIRPILTEEEIKEYVLLWEEIQSIQLDNSREDTITWRWTSDGEYTAKSAYNIQFEGTFSKIGIIPIWKAKAEPKCIFFAWTLLHKKILTANNLLKRNWPHDPYYVSCVPPNQRHPRICARIAFSQAKYIWSCLKMWYGLSTLDTIATRGSLHNYWKKCQKKIEIVNRRRFDGLIIYFWWNIWKERNKRTFQNKRLQPREVAFLCKEEFDQYQWASGVNVANGQ